MSEILIGEYLFRRLREIGIETVFGVPGDYELSLLDLVPKVDLKWVGTPNELVGAYAADGYAREKGAGALVTTFGPGELSALCGIGGAFCEFVPIIHIVGYPTSQAQASGKILHHTLGDLSYDHYVKMSGQMSCATAILKDAYTAASEIDRVLNDMLYHSQPGYIGIAEDVAYSKIPVSYLEKKIATTLPENNPDMEKKVVKEIIRNLESAKSPIIIVDGGAARGSWEKFVGSLVDALKVPFFTTILGKGAVDEQNPLYGGSYVGVGSLPSAIRAVEDSDCILWLGNLPSDFNTGMFSEHVKTSMIIDFQRFFIKVGDAKHDAKMIKVLPKLINEIKSNSLLATRKSGVELARPPKVPMPKGIGQDWLWDRLSFFLQPGDLIVSETGTSQFGIQLTTYPTGAKAWTQAVYGSIGYAAGAAIGLSIAAKEMGTYKRMVLITGEGSLQLTVQAFSMLNRHGIVPVVFILNNYGYTVERYFNGWEAKYNDVPMWDYSALFRAFSPEIKVKAFKVSTAADLDSLLSDKEFRTANHPQCVDMTMDPKDAPMLLKGVFEAKSKAIRS
ncbi:Pyruvate decarboxylase [Tolypocladium paradoxum]|uniref:Pyruvate decarboxylase n=1 Tax=Tolypocladium paradoxum TaxID=94208 RepID=A0A2S4KY70_9HYPO|nr:Pyruvate decarboxylase [Tolypocladium paradoxum]